MVVEHGPRVLSAKRAADYLGISRDLVQIAIEAGQLPTIQIGSRKMIPLKALEALLASGNVPNKDGGEHRR